MYSTGRLCVVSRYMRKSLQQLPKYCDSDSCYNPTLSDNGAQYDDQRRYNSNDDDNDPEC